MSIAPSSEPDWVHGHPHEPNPTPPSTDPALQVNLPGANPLVLTVEDLALLPQYSVDGCFIFSTGHGGSGPFTFTGVTLADLLQIVLPGSVSCRYVDVIGADGFGTRLYPADIAGRIAGRLPLLALQLDGSPLERAQGLIRLVAPDETDDALRQVKWVKRIDIVDERREEQPIDRS